MAHQSGPHHIGRTPEDPLVQDSLRRRPLPHSNSDPLQVGGVPAPCGLVCLPPKAHVAHNFPQGVPVTPRYSDKYPEHSETIPVSEYYRPIYQSLPLDHLETPRHVRDLIRVSEQSSVTKTHTNFLYNPSVIEP